MFFKKANLQQLSDKALLGRYQESGEQEVLGVLYNRHLSLVFGVSMKYLKDQQEAEDSVMEIYEKVCNDLRQQEIKYFKSWLYVVTRNFCLMRLQKKRTKNKQQTAYLINEGVFMESGQEMHLINESQDETIFRRLEACLKKLKEEQRKCVGLFFLEEKCYKEVVELTSFPLKKVKSYIQNGKRNLKICMEQNHEEPVEKHF